MSDGKVKFTFDAYQLAFPKRMLAPTVPQELPHERHCNTSNLQDLLADHERRIIALETRIAALEAALDKLTGEK